MNTYNQLNIAEFNTKLVPLCSVKTSRKLKKQNKTRFYIKALIGFLITALLISIIIIIKLLSPKKNIEPLITFNKANPNADDSFIKEREKEIFSQLINKEGE